MRVPDVMVGQGDLDLVFSNFIKAEPVIQDDGRRGILTRCNMNGVAELHALLRSRSWLPECPTLRINKLDVDRVVSISEVKVDTLPGEVIENDSDYCWLVLCYDLLFKRNVDSYNILGLLSLRSV